MEKITMLVIYSGRFHPFGPHHYQVYEYIKNKVIPSIIKKVLTVNGRTVGKEVELIPVLKIVTSDDIKHPKSPLSYDQKKK